MSAQTKKARKRPSQKQSRSVTRGSSAASLQKTVNVAVEKKTTGKRRGATRSVRGNATSASLLAASAAPTKRKLSRALAEARGLAKRDAAITADPAAASARTLTNQSVIDQNFKLWWELVRLSPFSFVLHQQAVIAKMMLGLLPSKPVR